MPELPEVETVRHGLLQILKLPETLAAIDVRRPDLRFPFPAALSQRLCGRRLTAIQRRSKFLLWDFGEATLISHLGMTGTWRLDDGQNYKLHDHLRLDFASGTRLLYHDPRRFGFLELAETATLAQHPRLQHLGPEPLDPQAFDLDFFQHACRGRRTPIKSLLMDARIVVGVGNIYASESCHRAGIRPLTAAGRLGRVRLDRLQKAVREILTEAIAAGGSTIRDFTQAGGSSGYFQHRFQVYGRAGQECYRCRGLIMQQALSGRATYWCRRCQAR